LNKTGDKIFGVPELVPFEHIKCMVLVKFLYEYVAEHRVSIEIIGPEMSIECLLGRPRRRLL
jgi:hypothetical protein